MTDTESAEADNGALQLGAVLGEHQHSQQSNFNALAGTLGSTLIHFGQTLLMLLIICEIREICLKTQMGKDKNQKGQGLKTRQGIDQETHLMRNTQTQTRMEMSPLKERKNLGWKMIRMILLRTSC